MSPRWMDKFQLSLLIRNLFNASYATPGGFEHVQASIPQDRRNFLVSLTCTL
jgi:outer membrane receptor protein involved in Fe transport